MHSNSHAVAQLLHELPALLSDLDASAASVLQVAHAAQLARTSAPATTAAAQRVTTHPGAASTPEALTEDMTTEAAGDVPRDGSSPRWPACARAGL